MACLSVKILDLYHELSLLVVKIDIRFWSGGAMCIRVCVYVCMLDKVYKVGFDSRVSLFVGVREYEPFFG